MGLDNMFDNKGINKTTNKSQSKNILQEQQIEPSNSTGKRPALGRPRTKTEDEKIINIAVPMSVYKKMNLAKIQYNNNLTFYINSLIERDLAENLETYKEKLLDI